MVDNGGDGWRATLTASLSSFSPFAKKNVGAFLDWGAGGTRFFASLAWKKDDEDVASRGELLPDPLPTPKIVARISGDPPAGPGLPNITLRGLLCAVLLPPRRSGPEALFRSCVTWVGVCTGVEVGVD